MTDNQTQCEDTKPYGYFMEDIYGCIDGQCKFCCRCNPIWYFGVKRNPQLPNRVNEQIEHMKKYNIRFNDIHNWKVYINAFEMGLINENLELIK